MSILDIFKKKGNSHYITSSESKRIMRENSKAIKYYEKRKKRKIVEEEFTTEMKDDNNVIEFENLHTYFFSDAGVVKAVNGVTFSIPAGSTVGVVGESGCGKSVTSLSLMQLVQGIMIEGGIQHPFLQAILFHQCQRFFFQPLIVHDAGFQLNIQQQIIFLQKSQHLIQGRYLHKAVLRMQLAKAEVLQFRQCIITDKPASVTGAVNPLIMANHHCTITAQLHIQLNAVRPHLRSLAEGKHRILRGILGIPTISTSMPPYLYPITIIIAIIHHLAN